MAEGFINTHTDHLGITTIEFYHPRGNSLPSAMLHQLAQEIHHAGLNSDTRVIVLKSAGNDAFCGGASFDEMSEIKDEKQGREFFSGFAHVINSMRTCTKIIIARVHGKAVGGGVGLIAAAEYAIATEQAEIRLSELSNGIGPFVVGPIIEKKLGLSAFMQLSIDAGMWRNADWAKRKGLYAEVHNSTAGMDESLQRLSHTLAHSSREAMTELKKIFWKDTEQWDALLSERAAISGRLATSTFTKDAIAKFKVRH